MFRIAALFLLAVSQSPRIFAEAPRGEPFGKTADGKSVERYTLENANGVVIKIITRGATITEIHAPDRSGKSADIALGFDDVAGYESKEDQYFGATIGRVGNRIAQGKFSLNGKDYSLAVNDGPNSLHGGATRSFDKVVWSAEGVETPEGPGVKFSYTSPDGEEGYPGEMQASVQMTLNDRNELRLQYEATTSAATPINLTNHSYFNLAGAGAATVLDHALQIEASQYTPTDATLIPTGRVEPVEGTPLDFRTPTRIGDRIEELTNTPNLGYDHNYVLDGPEGTLRVAAILTEPTTGRVLTVRTTEPGLQFYSGNFLHGQKGKDGKTYAHRSAVCLETQHFPDSIHHADFPKSVLNPGETYEHTCIYAFTAE